MPERGTPLPDIPAERQWDRQFLVTRGAPVWGGWVAQRLFGDLSLYLYPGAASLDVVNTSGECIGLFVGTVIDPAKRKICREPLKLDLPSNPAARDLAIESFAYRFGGSWLLLLALGDAKRLYLDADGTLSAVYDRALGTAAATTGLLLDDDAYRSRFDADLYKALGIDGEGWFPSGLTAHEGIERLLCNHYLDLDTWKTVRHWPREELRNRLPVRDSAMRVAEIVRNTVSALIGDGKAASALTGGNESRFLLAACRDVREHLDYFTVSTPATQRDVDLAGRLAALGGLRHSLLPFVGATPEVQAAWRYKAGHCATGTNMVSHPSIAPLSRYNWFVGGLGGEIGRAFFWRATDSESMRLDADAIVPRFGMPVDERVVEATRRWFSNIAGLNPLTQLDLAYLELRMSAWGFAPEYAVSIVPHIHPMIGRESYQLMLELPPEAKRGNGLIREGVAALWPELLQVPINRYGDHRDWVQALRRAADRKRVAKKLRKLFG